MMKTRAKTQDGMMSVTIGMAPMMPMGPQMLTLTPTPMPTGPQMLTLTPTEMQMQMQMQTQMLMLMTTPAPQTPTGPLMRMTIPVLQM
jgi:hypothetical protein